jgi:hypothetical protein
VRAGIAESAISDVSFQFVRHNDRNETVPCALAAETEEFDDIMSRSAEFGTSLAPRMDEVRIAL